MSIDKCVQRIKKAAGENKLTDADAKRIIKELGRERTAGKKTTIGDPDQEFLKRVDKLIQEDKTRAIIEKRNYLINQMKLKGFDGYAENFKNDYEAWQAFLAGRGSSEKGARSSVEARQMALTQQYLKSGLLQELDRENLLHIYSDKKYGKDIAIELFELDAENGNPGRSGSTEAVKIAKIVKRIQDDLVQRQNDAGAWIRKMPGYIVAQSHDMAKVRRASFEEWRDYILPRLDTDRTFDGIPEDAWEKQLQESYKGITTGVHNRANGALEADGLTAYRGPASIARKVSEHRVLHFSSPENWFEYNEKFGRGNVQMAVFKGIERAAKNLGLMEKMGPNAENMFNTIEARLVDRNKSDVKMVDKILGKDLFHQVAGDTPRNVFKELTGETSWAQSTTLSSISSGIRQWTNMTRLGGAVLSQFPDIVSKAVSLNKNGEHVLKGYQTGLTDLFFAFEGEDRKLAAKAAGFGFDGYLQSAMGRLLVEDGAPGWMSSSVDLFFKLTGMEYWNEAQKAGTARTLQALLGGQADLTFDNLRLGTAESLNLYGIGEREWDVIRKAKQSSGGVDFIAPELIEDQAIATQFFEYISDQVDYAVLTPGARERAIINKGTQAGTIPGELFRFLGQFKSFSITAVSKYLGRELQSSGSVSSKVGSLAHIMVASTVLGYASMTAKNIAQGKSPRNIGDPRTLGAAFIQGGGAGIYGDFLFGEYDRYGQGLLGTLAGPSLGQLEPAGRLWTQMMKGINPDTGETYLKGANVFQFAKNNTPFLNLFYVRSALDYLFLYGLQEELNPGYLRNMENRVKEDLDQQFYLPPSQYANQF
jgi:hypothetical protein